MRRVRRRLAGVPGATVVAVAILAAVAFVAAFGSAIAPYSPLDQDLSNILHGPSSAHLLGTDYLGRDILSRLLGGTRPSVLGALLAVGVGVALGVLPGMISVFAGSTTSFALMRVVDSLMTLPFIIFALAVAAVFGNRLSTVMIGVGVLLVPRFFRITRAATLALAKAEYVEAAALLGATRTRMVRTHVAMKVMPTVLVTVAQAMAAALLTLASLTFLGVGVPPPNPTWGGMLASTLPYIVQRPWDPFVPAAAIVVTVLALNLLADTATKLVGTPAVAADAAADAPVGTDVAAARFEGAS